MNGKNRMLLEQIAETQDHWRLRFHLMPPTGWLNDPNGLCQYEENYYVFFQYSPLDARGGVKMWGQYVSRDLIHWEFAGTPLLPDSPYDRDGVYSGSAFTEDGVMELFYTGNVKCQGDYDYINDGRESYTMYTRSQDGKIFQEKECLLEMSDYPENYTCHIRDPKVWKEGQEYYMVLGGRRKNDQGAVILLRSEDKKKWEVCNEITTDVPFGYMWECPDLFEIDGARYLSVSPQGLQREVYRYQNVYQSGYFPMSGDIQKNYTLGEFIEWDMGFDFYAPQTFRDNKNRRILIGWAGLPDIEDEYTNPTVDRGWQHALTVPRQITVREGRLLQTPVEELNCMRKECTSVHPGEDFQWKAPVFDWEITEINSGVCTVKIEEQCVITFKEGEFTLGFTGESGRGRTCRKAQVGALDRLRILADTSMLEIYLNDGEYVFTTRYYPEGTERKLELQCAECRSRIWKLDY